MIPILILQTSSHGFVGCREVLTAMGLTEDQDYRLYDDDIGIHHDVVPGECKFFITGSFSGNSKGIPDLVHKLRMQNPQLVCASYSIDSLPGSFDVVIHKNRGDEELQNTVRSFLKGEIIRTAEEYWSPGPALLEKIQKQELGRRIIVLDRSVENLAVIKAVVTTLDPKRAQEIFFTQSPAEAIEFVGTTGTTVVLINGLFGDHFPERYFGQNNLANVITNAKEPDWFGFKNMVISYGYDEGPDADLQGVIKREKGWSKLLARFLVAIRGTPLGEKTSGLCDELDELKKQFPMMDRMSCWRLRPCM